MDYQFEFKVVESVPIAVVRRRAIQAEFATVIPQACGEVWSSLRTHGIEGAGRLVAVYLDDLFNLEIGAEIGDQFSGVGQLLRSDTPAGLVATTTHLGPYHRLAEAYEALFQYCAATNRDRSGACWEVYGHWDEDPAKLRTDVFCLLRNSA